MPSHDGQDAFRPLQLARWAIVIWVVLFWKLGYPSLLDPDEAHYAQLTREMLRTPSWLVPLLDGQPFIDKPVLFHWLQGLSVAILGESELAMRLPSVCAALAIIATTRWLGTLLFDARVGERSALMLATTPLTFALGRIGMLDMLFSAFLFGGLSCLLAAALRSRDRLEYPGYLLVGLAVATKGPIALLLLGLLFFAALCAGREIRGAIARLHWIRGLCLICAVGSPWFIWMWMTFRDRFIHEYLVVGNLFYFTQPRTFSTRMTNYAFYLRTFAAGLFPWSLLALGYLVDTGLRWRHRSPSAAETLLWLWTFVVIGFFTFARFRLDHYIYPVAPACCLLAARGLSPAAETPTSRGIVAAAVLVAAVLIAGGAFTSLAIGQIDLRAGAPAHALPATLVLGGAAFALELIRKGALSRTSFVALCATLVAVYASIDLVAFRVLETSRPTAPLGRWIAQQGRDTPIGLYRLEDWRGSSRFYAERRAVRLDNDAQLRSFLQQYPDAYILMLGVESQRLRGEGLHLRDLTGESAIVGRAGGRVFRRQIWGRLVVAALDEGRTATRWRRAAARELDARVRPRPTVARASGQQRP